MSRMTLNNAPNNPKLDRLLKEAAEHKMTPDERREQRISWAYGQMMDCAPHLTKDDVRRIADETYGGNDGDVS